MTTMLREDSRLDGMSLGEIGVQRERPFCGHQTVIAASAVDEAQGHLPNGHERPGTRVLRVDFDGAVAQTDERVDPPDVGFMAADVALPRHEIEMVGLDIVRAALLDRLLLLGQELQFQSLDDGFGDFGLQREDIVQVAIVALGPEVLVTRTVDQLGGDAYAATRLAHAAFEDEADLEFAREFEDINMLALVHKRAVARNDGQCRNLAQISDDVLGDAVAEVLLLLIATHIGEGQDADRDAWNGGEGCRWRRACG